MSTAARTEPGTAVARQEPERDAKLSAEARARIQKIRSDNAFTMAVTQESWGDRMTVTTRRAFAEFIRRFRLDISEVDNLGNRPYRNGYYYRRRVAEMRTAGQVDWSLGEHIGPNKELDKLAAMTERDPAYDAELTTWAKDERRRRAQERIRWEVPDDATHAYVVRVKLKGDKNPLEGCDWITPTRMKKVKKWENKRFAGWEEKIADPVGADEPEKTVITRAWRRCGLLVAAEIPELKQEEAMMDAAVEEISVAIDERDDEESARELAHQRPRELMPASRADAPYEFDSDAPGNAAEPVKVTPAPRTEAQRAAAASVANAPDAYAEGTGASTGAGEADANIRPEPSAANASGDTRREATAAPASAASSARAPSAYIMKFGGEYVGRPISDVPTPELNRLLAWAEKKGGQEAFIDAAKVEIDQRNWDDEANA